MKNKTMLLTLMLSIVATAFFLNTTAIGQDLKSAENIDSFGQPPGSNPHSFTGTWLVQVQLATCSGTPLQSFSKLLAIHDGGTASEVSNSTSGAFRTTAFGVWEDTHRSNYVYALRSFRFNADGTFLDTVRAKWIVVVADDSNSYTGTATIQLVAPNGTITGNLCGTETGTRMVIPE